MQGAAPERRRDPFTVETTRAAKVRPAPPMPKAEPTRSKAGEDVEVLSLPVGDRQEVLRVIVGSYTGKDGKRRTNVSARRWFPDKATGALKPSRDGLTINPLDLVRIIEGLRSAEALLRRRGYIRG